MSWLLAAALQVHVMIMCSCFFSSNSLHRSVSLPPVFLSSFLSLSVLTYIIISCFFLIFSFMLVVSLGFYYLQYFKIWNTMCLLTIFLSLTASGGRWATMYAWNSRHSRHSKWTPCHWNLCPFAVLLCIRTPEVLYWTVTFGGQMTGPPLWSRLKHVTNFGWKFLSWSPENEFNWLCWWLFL